MQPNTDIPEKACLLSRLQAGKFAVPEFIYVPAENFVQESFAELSQFLERHRESYKVIARSAHPQEACFKGGTFDSLETYADIGGIKYARKRICKLAKTTKHLSIRRQQQFYHAPQIDIDQMGLIVMPFINGSSVMAKMMGDHWEFGYCRDRLRKVQSEPYITSTPHDLRLLQLSQAIQNFLGFRCEIEYIIASDGDIHVVQAKDISTIETLEEKESERAIQLDGLRRIRKRRNYRERPIFVMNNADFYIDIISQCEDVLDACTEPGPQIEAIINAVHRHEADMDAFALRHQRYAVLGLSIHDIHELFQVANHYLDEFPDQQAHLSKVLHNNLYHTDIFLAEADTLIARDKVRVNLCSHDAYGIDTVRNPLWVAYWNEDRHKTLIAEFKRLGFKTGDTIGIDIDPQNKPMVYRL